MKQSREKQAAEAYLKFLGKKGASAGTLYRRSLFLDSLIVGLADKPQNPTEFGKALVSALKVVTQLDKLECQNTAREFYPFWLNDVKAIALFEKHYGYDVTPVAWKPLPASLEKLTKSLENEIFDDRDTLALLRYSETLHGQGAEPLVVETRLKLAKVVMRRLQDAPVKNNITYRMAVDATLPLFKVKEVRELFLAVVRDFYYCWMESHT